MTDQPLALYPARSDDLDDIETLLEGNGLPIQDVRAKPECFFVARLAGETVGAGGLERYGSHGLLRSVVIENPEQGNGYGSLLCDELEETARARGVETLYLLTTTSEAFFGARGYERIARDSTPPAIQETTEFTELCPDSAVCMRKRLDGEAVSQGKR